MKALFITKRCLWLISGYLLVVPVGAFDFGNMTNPGKWFNGNRDRDYNRPPEGYGYPNPYEPVPGYGAPGYGAPGYGAPGYAEPGYAPPGYDASGYSAPGYVVPPTPATNTGSSDAAEIARLKKRVRELEAERASQTPQWQAAPSPGAQFNDSSGSAVEPWQTPVTPPPVSGKIPPAHEKATPVMPPPELEWQPSSNVAPSTDSYGSSATGSPGSPPVEGGGRWQDVPGEAERNASQYTPPPQYPGQSSFTLGR